MPLVAGRGAPQRRVWLLPRLGLDPAPRHLPELAGELVLLVGPAAHDVPDGLLPHPAALARVDAEALELGPGRRAAGPEVHPSAREQVEDGHRLGRADGVVVRLGHEPDAVAEPDALGTRRDGAVEHLGVRAVRVLLQEVVLDGPEGVPAEAVAGDGLLKCVLVGDELAVGLPWSGHGDLIEQRELHGVGSPRQRRSRDRPGLELCSAPISPGAPGATSSGGAMRGLGGRTYIVTGAASGIGHATAARLLDEGAIVDGSRPLRAARRRRGGQGRVGPLGLHPRRRDRRGFGRRAGPLGRRVRRERRRRAARGRGGGRGPGAPAARRGVGARDRREPDGHLPRGQARHRADAVPARARRRPARLGGDGGQHRGARGHGGWQRLQRIEGRRGAPDQEHGHRLRRPRHPRQRRSARVSSPPR